MDPAKLSGEKNRFMVLFADICRELQMMVDNEESVSFEMGRVVAPLQVEIQIFTGTLTCEVL